jgi:hypothetical protein
MYIEIVCNEEVQSGEQKGVLGRIAFDGAVEVGDLSDALSPQPEPLGQVIVALVEYLPDHRLSPRRLPSKRILSSNRAFLTKLREVLLRRA